MQNTCKHTVLYCDVLYGWGSSLTAGRSKCCFHPERLAGAFALAVTWQSLALPSIPELHAEGPRGQSGDENERECAGFLEVCSGVLLDVSKLEATRQQKSLVKILSSRVLEVFYFLVQQESPGEGSFFGGLRGDAHSLPFVKL